MAEVMFDTRSAESYRTFLKIKELPRYSVSGHVATFPDEYLGRLGMPAALSYAVDYHPEPFLFDYQAGVTATAIRKKRFALFIACGFGKTNCILSYARHVSGVLPRNRCVLIVCPLMVVRQTIAEAARFWGDALPVEQIRARDLQRWLLSGTSRIGITNYESLAEGLKPGRLGCLIPDESGIMKSAYGAYGQRLIELGRGLEWKLCATGTPAPNDRIEYANHAVFLDQFPTVNSFLARYFVNRGQTDNRWEMKPHALRPFYRDLSHWCVFLENPATYGYKDNVGVIPPISVHIHEVPLTDEQRSRVSSITGDMYGNPGGITSRSRLAQLAKGRHEGKAVPTNKPTFIRDLVNSWRGRESTIVWCRYNAEQDGIEKVLPGCGSIRGDTPQDERERIIADFQAGKITELVSKADVLGFGLNLQIATRHVFNGLWDSAEEYHQAIKRSNRVGSTRPLSVHIPVTDIEQAMVDNVLRKLRRMNEDIAEQEALFKECGYAA